MGYFSGTQQHRAMGSKPGRNTEVMSRWRTASVFEKICVKRCGVFTRRFKLLEPTVAEGRSPRTHPGPLWMRGGEKSQSPPSRELHGHAHVCSTCYTSRCLQGVQISLHRRAGPIPGTSRALQMCPRAPKHPTSLAHLDLESLCQRPKYFLSQRSG